MTYRIVRFPKGNSTGTGEPIISGLDAVKAAIVVLHLYKEQEVIGGLDTFEALEDLGPEVEGNPHA